MCSIAALADMATFCLLDLNLTCSSLEALLDSLCVLQIVNFGPAAQNVSVSLLSIAGDAFNSAGRVTTITSDDPLNENSFQTPEKVCAALLASLYHCTRVWTPNPGLQWTSGTFGVQLYTWKFESSTNTMIQGTSCLVGDWLPHAGRCVVTSMPSSVSAR